MKRHYLSKRSNRLLCHPYKNISIFVLPNPQPQKSKKYHKNLEAANSSSSSVGWKPSQMTLFRRTAWTTMGNIIRDTTRVGSPSMVPRNLHRFRPRTCLRYDAIVSGMFSLTIRIIPLYSALVCDVGHYIHAPPQDEGCPVPNVYGS